MQKLYPLAKKLFAKRNFLNRQKLHTKKLPVHIFPIFANFLTQENPPDIQYMY